MIYMRSHNEPIDLAEDSSNRELRLLSEVDHDPEVTQRALSQRLGIALGLTNLLLHNLAEKGYVRVTRVGWKRWLYTLTPAGISHKIRLTVAYVHRFLDHYRKVRQMLLKEMEPLGLNEESRIALYGTSEFAELVYLALREMGIEEVEIFGPGPTPNGKFLGMPVLDVADLKPERFDRVVIADVTNSQSAYQLLQELCKGKQKLVTFFADRQETEEVEWTPTGT